MRVMCTGRVDLAFILRAFQNGKDGVCIVGCWPGECHYITEGNYIAFSNMNIGRKLLELMGLNPERLRLEWVSSSEGNRFAEVMNDFSEKIKELGPLGQSEGLDENLMKCKLETAFQLVPYIKLVERERLRISEKSVDAYREFFASEAFDRLFKELIADKMDLSQIMALLREKPLNADEISEIMGLEQAEVIVHLNSSARQGLVEFDASQKRFIPV